MSRRVPYDRSPYFGIGRNGFAVLVYGERVHLAAEGIPLWSLRFLIVIGPDRKITEPDLAVLIRDL